MQAQILNKTEMERMIMGFRERELELDGFELDDVEREPGKLVFQFVHEAKLSEAPDRWTCEFNATPVVKFYYPGGVRLSSGERLRLTFTLTWWHEGNDGERLVSLPPTPRADKDYRFVFECAAA